MHMGFAHCAGHVLGRLEATPWPIRCQVWHCSPRFPDMLSPQGDTLPASASQHCHLWGLGTGHTGSCVHLPGGPPATQPGSSPPPLPLLHHLWGWHIQLCSLPFPDCSLCFWVPTTCWALRARVLVHPDCPQAELYVAPALPEWAPIPPCMTPTAGSLSRTIAPPFLLGDSQGENAPHLC